MAIYFHRLFYFFVISFDIPPFRKDPLKLLTVNFSFYSILINTFLLIVPTFENLCLI